METTVQYHLAWKFWHWEEWHQKISEEIFDSVEEAEECLGASLLESNGNIIDLEIIKVTTTYETIRKVK